MGLLDYLWHTYQAINEREEAEAAHQNEYIYVCASGEYYAHNGYHHGVTYVRARMPRKVAENMSRDEYVFWNWIQRELPDFSHPFGSWEFKFDDNCRYFSD